MEDQDEAALKALGIDPADVANAEASRSIKTGDLKHPLSSHLERYFCYHHFHLNIVVVLKPADEWIQGGKYIISHQLYLLPEMIKNLNYCNYS